MINYTCPKCHAAMSSPESLIGKDEACPECSQTARVPNSTKVSQDARGPIRVKTTQTFPADEALTYRVRCGGAVPPGKWRALLLGDGTLTVSEGRLRFAAKRKRTGLAALFALGLTVLPVLVLVMIGYGGFYVGPGWLIWFLLFDHWLKTPASATADATSGKAVRESKRGRIIVALTDGKWLSFQFLANGCVGRDRISTLYGSRLSTIDLPKRSRPERIVLWALVAVLIAFVAFIVWYLTAQPRA